ncbi:membrane protein insertion efficiency factor YidD, partial [Candidatus Margulisiibacteriota bacterium]
YKKLISPLLPDSCRYYPTCSEYAVQSLERHGAFKGLFFATRRVLSCNRLSRGGHDPVDNQLIVSRETIMKRRG